MLGFIGSFVVCLMATAITSASAQSAAIGSSISGNLALGRNISATSTCGLDGPQEYCVVAEKKCYDCDNSDPNLRHPAELMTDPEGRTPMTWWQAVNNVDRVTIQLDFETPFTFTYMVLTFRSYRPSAMILERSNDFGRTWTVYQYFAEDCQKTYKLRDRSPNERSSLTEVICTKKYSDVAPSSGGEVVFSALPLSIQLDDPYARAVLDHLSVTNLRVRLDALIRLGDENLDATGDVLRQYHHAIYDWTVRGQCQCYGHAQECAPVDGIIYNPTYKNAMIFGKCVCTQNTEGDSCERCKPLFWKVPWTPGGECQQCQCFGHADECRFDAAVFEASGKTDGGVCVGCRDNTAGNQCQVCADGFYPAPGRLLSDKNRCIPCRCDRLGSKGSGRCAQESNVAAGVLLGDCECKTNLVGRVCSECKLSTWNLTDSNPLGCQDCECFTAGTRLGSSTCDMKTGQCACKPFVTGKRCDECKAGHFQLRRADANGCSACDCDPGGSLSSQCNPVTGLCLCRDNIHRRRCSAVWPGYFFQNVDHLRFEAENSNAGSNTKVVPQFFEDGPVTWTGPGFLEVASGGTFSFDFQNVSKAVPYQILIRYESKGDDAESAAQVTITHIPRRSGALHRDALVDASSSCTNEPVGVVHEISIPLLPTAGEAIALSSDPICFLAKETYSVRVTINGVENQKILIDSVVLLPTVDSFGIFNGTSLGADWDMAECYNTRLRVSLHSNRSLACERLMFSMSAVINDGAIPCGCNPIGSRSPICMPFEGQCDCKPGILGRQCDVCQPRFFGLTSFGCTACNCDPAGSLSLFCDATTGQCPCVEGRTGMRCDNCEQLSYLDQSTKVCTPCNCNEIGSASLECGGNSDGSCTCLAGVTGSKCSQCFPGFYNFTAAGCVACDCDEGGSTGRTCDESGQCSCLEGVTGLRCDQCTPESFINPKMPTSCQSCFCSTFSSECKAAEGWYLTEVTSTFTEPNNTDGWEAPSVEWKPEGYLQATAIKGKKSSSLIWKAPEKFLGDKSTAYTQTFQFSLRLMDLVAPGAPLPVSYVQFHRSDPKSRAFHLLSPPPSTEWTQYNISVTRASWNRARLEGHTISGRELNQLLMRIDEILIFTGFGEGQPIAQAIRDIRLGVAVNDSSLGGNAATHVEECKCAESRVGRRCEQCAPGWTLDGGPFDSCVPCYCFNHSTQCHPETGVCLDCRQNTEGNECEKCKQGFYGVARRGGCDQCQCPGGVSGNQFADTCELVKGDSGDCAVQCDCQKGYTGCKCDECDVGYFGQPWRSGGGCFNCSCSGNGPPGVLENCDKETGVCKTCLYNTTGDQCEVCKDGFYGDGTRRDCRPCECDEVGSTGSVCNKETGQCQCKIGVVGQTCDSCQPNYWGFKDGRGCVPCLCCEGAANSQCDLDTGDCQCTPNVGGADDVRCCLCQTGFWNYSTDGCQACDCHPDGSLETLCNAGTGECLCKDNVVGDRCDRCQEGTSGILPFCEPCGECFDTWSNEVNRIRAKLANLTSQTNKITTSGTVTGFDEEFDAMERKLDNITAILNATDRRVLDQMAKNFSEAMKTARGDLDKLRRRIDGVEVMVEKVQMKANDSANDLDELRRRLSDLRGDINRLIKNTTDIEGVSIVGILNAIKEAENASNAAGQQVESIIRGDLFKAERQKDKAEGFVDEAFSDQQKENVQKLSEAEMQLDDFSRIVREAERDLCGKDSLTCDACGGVGCGGRCGGPNCPGAVNSTQAAEQFVAQAKTLAEAKLNKLVEVRDGLTRYRADVRRASALADEAKTRGLSAERMATEMKKNVSELFMKMEDFRNSKESTLSDVEEMINRIASLMHVVTVEDFQEIINQINGTIRNIKMNLTQIESWKKELESISKARTRAETANRNAEEILKKIEGVESALAVAKRHQNASEVMTKLAKADKKSAEDKMKDAEDTSADVRSLVGKTDRAITNISGKVQVVKDQLKENEGELDVADKESQSAKTQVMTTQENLDDLSDEISRLMDHLKLAIDTLKKRSGEAGKLKKEADDSLKEICEKSDLIKEFEKDVADNDREIVKLEKQTDEYEDDIEELLASIQRKTVFHSTCTKP